jgi:tetratricopeptide (TPR) repeat protein
MLGAAWRQGADCRYDRARRYLEESLQAARKVGYRFGELVALGNLLEVDLELGRVAEAERRLADTLELARALEMPAFDAYAQLWQAEHERARGNPLPARAMFAEALTAMRGAGIPRGIAEGLLGLARCELEQGNREDAQPLLEEAAAMVKACGFHEPGPLPEAYLALLGARDPATVDADFGPLLLQGEAHLLLYFASGDRSHLDTASARLESIAASLDESDLLAFWQHNPVARRLREAQPSTG